MRLIATLGANMENLEHEYVISDMSYIAYFSFQALAKHSKIADKNINIIGTSKTKDMLDRLSSNGKIPNYALKIVEDEDPKNVMEASLELLDENCIIDLTQGLRSHPMLTLIASIYSRSLEGKNVNDIFYARITNANKNPSKEMCQYKFDSLIEYLDMANIASVMETFTKSLVVPAFSISYSGFKDLEHKLSKLSAELLVNNIDEAIKTASDVKKEILHVSQKDNLRHLTKLFESLSDDIEKICSINPNNEDEKYLVISNLFFDKKLYLQSITTLFEASLALLEKYVVKNKINIEGQIDPRDKSKGIGNCIEKQKYTYNRRNCLKKGVKDLCKKGSSDKILQNLNKLIGDIDIQRNLAAHAFLEESKKPFNVKDYIDSKLKSLVEINKLIECA